MATKARSRDVLVMIVFLVAAFLLALVGYARMQVGQDPRLSPRPVTPSSR